MQFQNSQIQNISCQHHKSQDMLLSHICLNSACQAIALFGCDICSNDHQEHKQYYLPIQAILDMIPKNYSNIKLENQENCGEDSSNSDSTKYNEDAEEINCPYIFENEIENSNQDLKKLIKHLQEDKCSHKAEENCIKSIMNNTDIILQIYKVFSKISCQEDLNEFTTKIKNILKNSTFKCEEFQENIDINHDSMATKSTCDNNNSDTKIEISHDQDDQNNISPNENTLSPPQNQFQIDTYRNKQETFKLVDFDENQRVMRDEDSNNILSNILESQCRQSPYKKLKTDQENNNNQQEQTTKQVKRGENKPRKKRQYNRKQQQKNQEQQKNNEIKQQELFNFNQQDNIKMEDDLQQFMKNDFNSLHEGGLLHDNNEDYHSIDKLLNNDQNSDCGIQKFGNNIDNIGNMQYEQIINDHSDFGEMMGGDNHNFNNKCSNNLLEYPNCIDDIVQNNNENNNNMHLNNSTRNNNEYIPFENDVEAAIDDYFKGKNINNNGNNNSNIIQQQQQKMQNNNKQNKNFEDIMLDDNVNYFDKNNNGATQQINFNSNNDNNRNINFQGMNANQMVKFEENSDINLQNGQLSSLQQSQKQKLLSNNSNNKDNNNTMQQVKMEEEQIEECDQYFYNSTGKVKIEEYNMEEDNNNIENNNIINNTKIEEDQLENNSCSQLQSQKKLQKGNSSTSGSSNNRRRKQCNGESKQDQQQQKVWEFEIGQQAIYEVEQALAQLPKKRQVKKVRNILINEHEKQVYDFMFKYLQECTQKIPDLIQCVLQYLKQAVDIKQYSKEEFCQLISVIVHQYYITHVENPKVNIQTFAALRNYIKRVVLSKLVVPTQQNENDVKAKRWSKEEVNQLMQMLQEQVTYFEIARRLNRPYSGIVQQINKQRKKV